MSLLPDGGRERYGSRWGGEFIRANRDRTGIVAAVAYASNAGIASTAAGDGVANGDGFTYSIGRLVKRDINRNGINSSSA